MLRSLYYQIKRHFPLVSVMLIASCLLSTLPQFFMDEAYSDISGQVASFRSYFLLTLSSFTHSPGFLAMHLTGNILVFAVFGMLSEIILGSRRFATVSLFTFIITLTVNYLHSDGAYAGHGASGIAWGYHVVYVFFIIVLFQNSGKRVLKDIYVIFSLLLLLFDFIGIPLLEVKMLGMGFMDNFGQYLHLLSMLTLVPFMFAWRKDIDSNILKIIRRQPVNNEGKGSKWPFWLLALILVLNIFGTGRLIAFVSSGKAETTYEISYEETAKDTGQGDRIVVDFDSDISDISRELCSISYNDENSPVVVKDSIAGNRKFFISLSRKLDDDESVKLVYRVKSRLDNNILIKSHLDIEY